MSAVSMAEVGAPPTLYLGISGVCHPSESTYHLVRGRSPWNDGHAKYEGLPVLEAALAPFPDVEIILTAAEVRTQGFDKVLEQLGPVLAKRVAGYTYLDLTAKVTRLVRRRDASDKEVPISDDDYRRMSKAQVVTTHVAWRRPKAWIAVDDEDILWPPDVRREKLVLTDGCLGLRDPFAQDQLSFVLSKNFSM